MKKLFTLLFLLCAFNSINAQSGWDSILQNNHIAAKNLFKANLKSDSTNKEALQGLIYLAEIEEDFFSYEKYINSLFNTIQKNTSPVFFTNNIIRNTTRSLLTILLFHTKEN